MTIWYVVAGLVALFIVGMLLLILLPNRALTPIDSHQLGDFTQGGLARNIINQI